MKRVAVKKQQKHEKREEEKIQKKKAPSSVTSEEAAEEIYSRYVDSPLLYGNITVAIHNRIVSDWPLDPRSFRSRKDADGDIRGEETELYIQSRKRLKYLTMIQLTPRALFLCIVVIQFVGSNTKSIAAPKEYL